MITFAHRLEFLFPFQHGVEKSKLSLSLNMANNEILDWINNDNVISISAKLTA